MTVDVNEAACQMFGCERWELLSLSPRRLLAPEETRDLSAWIPRLVWDRRLTDLWTCVRKDGSRFRAEIAAPRFPPGGSRTA